MDVRGLKELKLNFHWQIIVLIAAGMFLLAVIASLTAGYLINKRVSALVYDQAAQITTSFAHQSILPLLSGVGDGVVSDLESTLAYSNVKALAIYTKDGELLIGSDYFEQQKFPELFPVDGKPFKPKLVQETQSLWVFIAPVYDTDVFQNQSGALDTLFTQSPTLLGYASVVVDTSKLLKIQHDLLKDNLIISIAIAMALLLAAVLITHNMVRPLYQFISLMKKAEEGDDSVRARLAGPVEIKNMSRAFNTMMQALEQRREYAEKQHDSLLQEIDERGKVENALRESESSLKALLAQHEAVIATVPGIIVEVDKTGRLIWWNKRLEQVAGLSKDQIARKNVIDFAPNEESEKIINSLQDTFIDGKGELHMLLLTKDGRIPYQFNGVRIDSPSGDPGESTVLAIGIDDSESVNAQLALKKARDMALETARIKSEFLANMSHEIRTPMNGMLGMLQLLARSKQTAEQQNFSEIALRSADHLMGIINDVLDYSKIEAGKLDLHKSEFVLRELIEDVIELFATRAHEKGLGIYADVSFDAPRIIVSDPQRLKQIVSNLVGNAIKFTDHGHVLVQVTLTNSTHISSDLVISVIDTGIGIEEEAHAKVFESFAQADGSSTRKYSGTGLGLAIVKQLSDMLGGAISLESELSQGSKFSVSFPLDHMQPKFEPEPVDAEIANNLMVNYINGRQLQSSVFKRYADYLGLGYRLSGIDDYVDYRLDNTNQVFIVDADSFNELTTFKIWPKLSGFKIYVLVDHSNTNNIDPLIDKYDNVVKQLIPIRFKCFVAMLAQDKITAINKEMKQRHTTRSPSSKHQILVVEDNEINQRVIVTMLSKLGHEALLATDGRQALEILQDNDSVKLVLMDCQMPVMDGYEATRQIRAREINGQHINIVAMTGNALEGDREKCLGAGMDDHVAKPIRLSALKESLSRWLSDEANG